MATFFPALPSPVCRKTSEFPLPAANSVLGLTPVRQKTAPVTCQQQNLPNCKHRQFLPVRCRDFPGAGFHLTVTQGWRRGIKVPHALFDPFTRQESRMLRLPVLILSLLYPASHAANFNACTVVAADPVAIKLDEPCPDWKDLPGVDGRKWSLADFRDKSVLVLCFTCNSCPYSVDYEDRLLAFAKKYASHPGGVALVAVNANRKPSETLEKMQERAKQKGFTFPYVVDETQQLAAACGAVYTPEFLVFNRERKLIYRGAMDDRTNPTEVTVRHVENAVEAALRQQLPEIREVPARGCAIPFRRSRR
jgi:peroxiredoxin